MSRKPANRNRNDRAQRRAGRAPRRPEAAAGAPRALPRFPPPGRSLCGARPEQPDRAPPPPAARPPSGLRARRPGPPPHLRRRVQQHAGAPGAETRGPTMEAAGARVAMETPGRTGARRRQVSRSVMRLRAGTCRPAALASRDLPFRLVGDTALGTQGRVCRSPESHGGRPGGGGSEWACDGPRTPWSTAARTPSKVRFSGRPPPRHPAPCLTSRLQWPT